MLCSVPERNTLHHQAPGLLQCIIAHIVVAITSPLREK
ncbi:hypothetical protein C900_02394 [Fulvivirga imtechensis AK7]|uniref:Uncharacterized protein n=1 Tax=Fulvivirga imtechensis AK7 TaxID=1237149 RepID=L8JTT5_9BACT|nr:hypothetical protein C900_02394 [Fulvivirga imtechensis AK7]